MRRLAVFCLMLLLMAGCGSKPRKIFDELSGTDYPFNWIGSVSYAASSAWPAPQDEFRQVLVVVTYRIQRGGSSDIVQSFAARPKSDGSYMVRCRWNKYATYAIEVQHPGQPLPSDRRERGTIAKPVGGSHSEAVHFEISPLPAGFQARWEGKVSLPATAAEATPLPTGLRIEVTARAAQGSADPVLQLAGTLVDSDARYSLSFPWTPDHYYSIALYTAGVDHPLELRERGRLGGLQPPAYADGPLAPVNMHDDFILEWPLRFGWSGRVELELPFAGAALQAAPDMVLRFVGKSTGSAAAPGTEVFATSALTAADGGYRAELLWDPRWEYSVELRRPGALEALETRSRGKLSYPGAVSLSDNFKAQLEQFSWSGTVRSAADPPVPFDQLLVRLQLETAKADEELTLLALTNSLGEFNIDFPLLPRPGSRYGLTVVAPAGYVGQSLSYSDLAGGNRADHFLLEPALP